MKFLNSYFGFNAKLSMKKLGKILADRKHDSWFSGFVFRHFAIGIIWEKRESHCLYCKKDNNEKV